MQFVDPRRLREDELWDLMYAFGGGAVPLGDPVSLLTPGIISGAFNVQRTQASGAMATALNADGVTWREVAADTARFHGAAQRLLVEGARTNMVPNPRGGGGTVGAIGSGGAYPTGWGSAGGTHVGLTVEYLGPVTVLGLPGGRFRFSGVASATATGQIFFQATTAVSLVPHNASLTVGFPASPLPPNTASLAFPGETGITAVPIQVTPARYNLQKTLTITPMRLVLALNYTSGQPYDFTVDLAAPQFEVGDFVSTPILPAVGVPAASTRGRDSINAALTTLNIPESAKGTLVFSSALSAASTATTAARTLVDFNDNTASNRIWPGVGAGTSNVIGSRVSSGSPAVTGAVGTAALTPSRVAMAIDGTGGVRFSVNGGVVQGVTGAPIAALLSLRLGDEASATSPLFGTLGDGVWYPGVAMDQQLQALAAP